MATTVNPTFTKNGDKLIVTTAQKNSIEALGAGATNGEVAKLLGFEEAALGDPAGTFGMVLQVKNDPNPNNASGANDAKSEPNGASGKRFAQTANPPTVDAIPTTIKILAVRTRDFASGKNLAIVEGVLPNGDSISFGFSEGYASKLRTLGSGDIISVVFETRIPGKTTWRSTEPELIAQAVGAGAAKSGDKFCHVYHASDLVVNRVINRVITTEFSDAEWNTLVKNAERRFERDLKAGSMAVSAQAMIDLFVQNGMDRTEAIQAVANKMSFTNQ